MMSKTGPNDNIQEELKKRLIETGDWDRIVLALERYLVEQGIDDDMRIRAEDLIRNEENPTLKSLKEGLLSSMPGMIPQDIQKAVKQEIEAALEKQLQ